jgi:hypothetical protein
MCRLRDAVNETIHLSVPDGLHCIVMVDRVDCNQTVRTYHQVGDTSPPHATATGHVAPAHLPRADVDAVIDGGLESYGDSTITDPQELRAELPRVRQDGYALNRNQFLPDVCAISMPGSRYDAGELEQRGRMVADTAAEIAPGAWSESERGRWILGWRWAPAPLAAGRRPTSGTPPTCCRRCATTSARRATRPQPRGVATSPRQTFHQRLRSTEHLLGCDLESGEQGAQLHVAVMALDVPRPAGGGPSASAG